MRKLRAIAGLTIRAAVRQRVFWAIAGLLAVVVLVLPANLADDGTLIGRARLLINYTLGLSHALLCVATLWLAADSLTREVAAGQAHLVAVKPIARWQVLGGKWLGLLLLDAVLLAGCAAGTAWQLRRAVADPRWSDEDRRLVALEIVTARREHRPQRPDFHAEAEAEVERRLRGGALTADDNLLHARTYVREDLEARWQTVPPGYTREWTFVGLEPPAEQTTMLFRFRLRTVAPPPGGAVAAVLSARGAGAQPVGAHQSLPPDAFLAFRVPRDLATADRTVVVSFSNESPVTVTFPLADGPTLLYRVGGFGGNLVRTTLILFGQLAFLAAVGLLLGSRLSFPVAAFAAVGYLLCAAHVPFLRGQLDEGLAVFNPESTPLWLEWLGRGLVRAALWLTGSLTDQTPIGALAGGIVVSWEAVGAAAWRLGLARTGLVLVVAAALWTRRELALGGDR